MVHKSISQVFFVFTAACFEPESSSVKAGIGAVLADASGKLTHFLSVVLEDDLGKELNFKQVWTEDVDFRTGTFRNLVRCHSLETICDVFFNCYPY